VTEQFATVDEYLASFPDDVEAVLQELRRTIRGAVPNAGEKISYRIPAMTLDGKVLVYFAGWKDYVSMYPLPEMDAAFEKELAPYVAGKGTVRFAHGRPLPHDLIERFVKLHARRIRPA